MTTEKLEENTAVETLSAVTEATSEAPSLSGDDLTRLREENEQLRTSIRSTQAHRQITGELERVGARSPGLLYDAIKGDVTFAEDGSVENQAALISRLKAVYPEQFGFAGRGASIDGGAGTSKTAALTREALARMSVTEIAALDWNDVRDVLSQG